MAEPEQSRVLGVPACLLSGELALWGSEFELERQGRVRVRRLLCAQVKRDESKQKGERNKSNSQEDLGKSFGLRKSQDSSLGCGRTGITRPCPGRALGNAGLEAQSETEAKSPRLGPRRHTVHSWAAQEFIVGVKLMRTWEGGQA